MFQTNVSFERCYMCLVVKHSEMYVILKKIPKKKIKNKNKNKNKNSCTHYSGFQEIIESISNSPSQL